jgi:hypothetical protein
MKIQNRDDFQNSIDEQLSYRKKEISMLKLLFMSNDPQYEKRIINRLIIPQVYSHYEGFIKTSSVLFLYYIKSTYNPRQQIADNIFALQMREKIMDSSKSKSCSIHVGLIENMRIIPNSLNFDPKKIIDTHSNLKARYLEEIMFMCGIHFNVYWQNKSFFIDNILLKNRNLISHGERVEIDDATVVQCLSNVSEILEKYKTELEGQL